MVELNSFSKNMNADITGIRVVRKIYHRKLRENHSW